VLSSPNNPAAISDPNTGIQFVNVVPGDHIGGIPAHRESRLERLPALAAELVRRRANVIYAPNLGSALAAKAATQTIPIVFVTGGDPIKFGLVASLNRPGENITGVAILSNKLIAKRLEMLRELVPSGSLCAFLVNPTNPFAEVETRKVQAAAAALGLRVLILNAKFASDYETVFAMLAKEGVRHVH
jgi:putative tryptophan/tyrosine transport system substrate-binding protein